MHGSASFDAARSLLTIKVMAKRGKKMVPNVSHYLVTDTRPDPAVASPAYALAKCEIVTDPASMSAAALESGATEELIKTGDVWHVCVDEYGPRCDCGDGHFRNRVCKHCKALIAISLIPGEVVGNV